MVSSVATPHRAARFLLLLLLMATSTPAAWVDPDWLYRKQITIDSGQIDGNLSGFPVLISLAADAELAAAAQADGDDIRFTAADETTPLAHEIEEFDSGSGALVAWVNVPSLSASVDTVVYVYYGNPAAPNQEDVDNVWDANYVNVMHLAESPSGAAGELVDSSGYDNHGQSFGMGAANSVAGQIGPALNFVRADALDQVRVYNSATLDSSASEGTLEYWVRFVEAPPSSTYYLLMVHSQRFSGFRGMEHAWRADDNFFMYTNAGDPGGDTWSGTSSHGFGAGTWHHVVWRWRRVPGQVHDLFTDGTSKVFDFADNSANWSVDATIDDWYFGGIVDRNDRWFDGRLDEIRISNVMRSDAWISTQHNNQRNPATFITLGPQTTPSLAIVKRAFWPDGTPIPNGVTLPTGVEFKYLLYINNPGAARTDVSVQDELDAAFLYQAGTIQVDNSVAECAATVCTPAEEQTVFAAVAAAPVLTDAEDGDVASYTAAGPSVDAGDGNAANARLDIGANAVWAMLFSVKMP